MPISGSFVGVGVDPRLARADAVSTRRVRLTFSEPMALDAELIDLTNYTITPDGGSTSRTVLSVTAEPFVPNPSYVELQLDGDLTVAGADNYLVTVADTVSDAAGNTLDPAHDTADFTGVHTTLALDHCAIAKSRLAWQFHGKPNIEAVVCAAGDRTQEVDQALADVQAYRSIETAFGTTQDNVGTNLNLARFGCADAEYRVRQRAKAKVIGSGGHPDDLIDVITLLDDGYSPATLELRLPYPACAIIYGLHLPLGNLGKGAIYARDFLRLTKPAGVHAILEYWEDGVTTFEMREVGGPATTVGAGFSEVGGAEGGKMKEASA